MRLFKKNDIQKNKSQNNTKLPMTGRVKKGFRFYCMVVMAKDICGLKVEEIAAKDCVLFLWATFPQLPEALRVIKAWGFQYKTVAFVWLKQNKSGKGWFFGLGFWTRGNAEICLLAIKGKPHRNSNRVHQFLISPIRGHSQKPEEAREKIVELMGDLPRVELFAREKTEGCAYECVWI